MLKPIWTILWKSIAFFILWSILYSPFVVWLAPKVEGTHLNIRLYFDATGALTIFIAAWVMVRFVDRRSFSTLGFDPIHLVRDSALGILIGIAWLAFSLAIVWLFGWATPQSSGQLDSSVLVVAVIAMILNTVIQEVLARGYIFQTIQFQSNATWAVIVTSIIFVLYHTAGLQGNWLPAINVFCSGVLFSTAYYRTGNLWLPIAIHFTWNFLLGPILGLSVSGQDLATQFHLFALQGPVIFTGGSFGIEGSLIVTVITIFGIASFLRWYPWQSNFFNDKRPTLQEMEHKI